MKLNRLVAARAVIFSKCAGEKLPAHIAYKFAKFLRLTDGDETFFNERFKAVLDSYAQKDENGHFVRDGERGIALKPDCTETCRKEMQELENTEIELPFQFTLNDISCLTLSIKDCFELDELIMEESDNANKV